MDGPMQHRAFLRGWLVSAALALCAVAAVLAAPDALAAKLHKPRPPQTTQQLRQHVLVRREMFVAMKRERMRHRARMQELVQRDRATRRTKDVDEKQRVHDLVMAERLLFAQRMRDLRAKAPVDR